MNFKVGDLVCINEKYYCDPEGYYHRYNDQILSDAFIIVEILKMKEVPGGREYKIETDIDGARLYSQLTQKYLPFNVFLNALEKL